MHEENFTQQIVETILDELKNYANAKPKRIKVQVGEMLHLIPESVQLHFQILSRSTHLEGAELDLKEVPVSVRCLACHQIGGVQDHHFLACLSCGSMDVELLSGQAIIVESIELEEGEVPS